MSVDGLVQLVTDGPFLLAAPIALLAGLVSFLSPCCLPLVPGYLSYITGLAGSNASAGPASSDTGLVDISAAQGGTSVAVARRPNPPAAVEGGAGRLRVLLASVLFVLGFSVPFVAAGAAFGNVGSLLAVHQTAVDRVAGVFTILLGLAFLGAVPFLQREMRVHRLPRVGVAGAPLLGLTFGVGWTPCLGPTLAAVQTLAFTQATAGRGAALTFVYCLGLGLPFVAAALAFDKALRVFAVVKRHYALITYAGGAMMIAVGALLLTGVWGRLIIELRGTIAGFTTPL